MTATELRAINRECNVEIPDMDWKTALAQINQYFRELGQHNSNQEALIVGMFFCNKLPIHQCYWNDRFCAAVVCNLPFSMKQAGAWAMIKNSRLGNGYFEWITHYGFHMTKILKSLGIVVNENGVSPKVSPPYYQIPNRIIDDLITTFDLPMNITGQARSFSPEERKLQLELDQRYIQFTS